MCLFINKEDMELDRKDIKRYILIAKAIDADICDYDNYDIEQAFARNQKRITAYSWKQKYLNNALRIAAILLLPFILSTGFLSYLYIKIMADIIFNDPAKREKIDQLTHPLVWEAIRKEAGKHADQPVVIEAAVPSKDFRDICDKMWYLYTSREVRIRRLKESRGYSDKKAESIMANQATESEFRSFADAQIDNSGSEEETRKQIDALLEKDKDKVAK